jgi:electron transfer flavoprotein beta subunit
MDVIVCIKQVPDTTEVDIDPEKGTLIRDGIAATVNPFDMYAIEESLKIRETHGGSVTALSMGPPQAESVLRDAIALGCDRGILLSDRAFAGSDTLATSYALSAAIRKVGSYDLVICGIKTTDGDTGQVGPGVAEELGIPHVSYVRQILDLKDGSVTLERTLDEVNEKVRAPLPCLITVTKEINEPRLPSFKGKMAARKAEVPVWTPADIQAETERLGADGSPTWVVKVFHPTSQRSGECFEGTPDVQAELLVSKLRERSVL